MVAEQNIPAGTAVLCNYRMCCAHQYWLHETHIGIVEKPSDSEKLWNGHNSERQYCELTETQRVRYPFGVMHDDELVRVSLIAEAIEAFIGVGK